MVSNPNRSYGKICGEIEERWKKQVKGKFKNLLKQEFGMFILIQKDLEIMLEGKVKKEDNNNHQCDWEKLNKTTLETMNNDSELYI